jgi:NADH dehydrogenase FAD-containing subunit
MRISSEEALHRIVVVGGGAAGAAERILPGLPERISDATHRLLEKMLPEPALVEQFETQ